MYRHNDGMTDMEREMRIAVNKAAIHRLTHKRTNAETVRKMRRIKTVQFTKRGIIAGQKTSWNGSRCQRRRNRRRKNALYYVFCKAPYTST